jgi:alpha-beta hydrolase superfamily lysophospholipase
VSNKPQPLTTEDFMVPAQDPGIEIFVRNKRPSDMRAFRPERTVLFVHGATYPAHTTFDLPIEGCSWMDHIAARGYDVYLLDLRGYGRSTRPPEMVQSPDANPPIVRTETAVKDIAAFCSAGRGARSRRRLTRSRIQIKSRGLRSMRRSGSARPAGLRRPRGAACPLTAR